MTDISDSLSERLPHDSSASVLQSLELRVAFVIDEPALATMLSDTGLRPFARCEADSEQISLIVEALRQSIEQPFKSSRALNHVRVGVAATIVVDQLGSAGLLAAPLTLSRARQWLECAGENLRLNEPFEQWRVSNGIDAVLVIIASRSATCSRQPLLGAARPPSCGNEGVLCFSRIALVDGVAALRHYAAAHELGHLLGLKHASELQSADLINELALQATTATSPVDSRAAARGWQCPDLRLQTVMGDLPVTAQHAYTVVPAWSEPGVDWIGNLTAEVGTRARGCVNLADEVSYLREVLPQFVAWRSPR